MPGHPPPFPAPLSAGAPTGRGGCRRRWQMWWARCLRSPACLLQTAGPAALAPTHAACAAGGGTWRVWGLQTEHGHLLLPSYDGLRDSPIPQHQTAARRQPPAFGCTYAPHRGPPLSSCSRSVLICNTPHIPTCTTWTCCSSRWLNMMIWPLSFRRRL